MVEGEANDRPVVGFCGLGTMGQPMAAHVAAAGYELHVWNRTRARGDELADRTQGDVTVETTPGGVASRSDVLLLMLWDGDAVNDVLFGEGGAVHEGAATTLVVDMSTTSPAFAEQTAARLAHAGIRYVDAPVTGAAPRAQAGTLTLMAGGDQADLDVAEQVAAPFTSTFRRVGSVSSGQLFKLANNVLGFINIIGVVEALALVDAAGGDVEAAVEVFLEGTGRSAALEVYGPLLAQGRYDQGVSARVAAKDLGEALQAGQEVSCRLPVAQAVQAAYEEALTAGPEEAPAPCHAVYRRLFPGADHRA